LLIFLHVALEIATGLPPKLPPFVLTLFASW
jgi:hypothetical protein